MNFDKILFHKIAFTIKNSMIGATINRIEQVANQDFCFFLYQEQGVSYFYLSCHPSLAHFTLRTHRPNANPITSVFLDSLRSHLTGSVIQALFVLDNDRIMRLTCSKENEIGHVITRSIYLELTGKRTNIILCKEDEIIIDSLYKYAYDEGTKRMIARGIQYRFPEVKMSQSLSPLLQKEASYRQVSEAEIIRLTDKSDALFVYPSHYHLLPLLHRQEPYTTHPLLEGLELFYTRYVNQLAREEIMRPILKTIQKETTRLEKRQSLLEAALAAANQAHKEKYYGDLIFTYSPNLSLKLPQITLFDEALNTSITIPLDEKFDMKTNANRYYLRYKKLQASRHHVLQQMALCQEELLYFEELRNQLQYDLSLVDLQQIKQELDALPSSRNKTVYQTKKPKRVKQIITLTKYMSPEGFAIFVGKNNLQNDYLTFTVARPNDTFFHVKDFPGSHVVVQGTPLGEVTIRLAAKIAAYYSKARYSSTIPVDYTSVSHVKKLSGGPLGKVLLKKQKTIYIDIDEDLSSYLAEKR